MGERRRNGGDGGGGRPVTIREYDVTPYTAIIHANVFTIFRTQEGTGRFR